MKKTLLSIPLLLALCGVVSAQVPNSTAPMVPIGSSGGGGGVTGGPFTAGDLVAGNGSSAIQDSSACTTQCVLPNKLELNIGSFTPSSTLGTAGALGLWVNESVTGNCGGGCVDNYLNISSDAAVVGSGSSGTFLNGVGWYFNHNFGGVGTGDRITGVFNFNLASTSANTAQNASYSALAAFATASANDNGTAATSGGSRSNLEAMNVIATMVSGATNWAFFSVAEFDTAINTGASVYNKEGIVIAQLATDKIAGVNLDDALEITNQSGAVGWTHGISFGASSAGWPFTAGATAIGCFNSCGTLTNVIDFSAATISGNMLKSPGINIAGAAVGSATVPNIDFITCGTQCGWYASASGALAMTVGGAVKFEYGIANPGRLTAYVSVESGNGSGWLFSSSAASSTVPTIVPNGSASSTGFGAQAAGNISAIVAGTEVTRFIAGGLNLPTAATGTPTASLCLDASNNVIKKTTTGSCI